MRRLWTLVALTCCLCWISAADESRPLALGASHLELTAGRSVPLPLGNGAPAVDSRSMSVSAATEPAVADPIAAGLRTDDGGIFLAAPPTMTPGLYTVRIKLSDADGREFTASVQVRVNEPEPVAAGEQPPLILINGFDTGSVLQGGCTLAPDSTGTFGQLEALVTTDGASVKFFDNCVYGTPRIEVLGEKLGEFISMLKQTDGGAVAQVDIVGFSMGALVARSYLAGKKVAAGTFEPPVDPKVRKLILVASENFGAPLANLINIGEQIPQLKPASLFTWELNTWHQGYDDLREVDALAIAGTGGAQGATDGVAPLPGASLSSSIFFNRKAERTRILPACHNQAAASQCTTAAVIMSVDSANHPSGRIIRSFLAGTDDWRQIGDTPANNTVLTAKGTANFALKDGTDAFVTNITGVVAVPPTGPRPNVTLVKGPVNIYRADLADGGAYNFQVSRPGANAVFAGSIPTGGGSATQAKLGPRIDRILPSAGLVDTLSVGPDSLISMYGAELADAEAFGTTLPLPTQLGGTTVTANGALLGLLYAGPGQINAFVPAGMSGLVRIKVANSKGQHTVNLIVAAAVPAIFAANGSGAGPAAAVHALTGQLLTAQNPTSVGGFVSLYVTGLGELAEVNGLREAVIRPEVTVGGVAARVLYAGPSSFIGLNQINIEILPGTPTGAAVPVTVRSGTHVSNQVTLAIQ